MSAQDIEFGVANGVNRLADDLRFEQKLYTQTHSSFNDHLGNLGEIFKAFQEINANLKFGARNTGNQANNEIGNVLKILEQSCESLTQSEALISDLIPEPLANSRGSGDEKHQSVAEITDFKLDDQTDNKNDIQDNYSLKVTIWGEKDVENASLLFCSSEKEISILAIKRLQANKSETLRFSIPYDLFFTSQYAGLYLVDSELKDLAHIEVYPIQIMEVMKINENLQVKVKNNLGTSLKVIIVEENSFQAIRADLKAGEIACYTFGSNESHFAVYVGDFMRSNEMFYTQQD